MTRQQDISVLTKPTTAFVVASVGLQSPQATIGPLFVDALRNCDIDLYGPIPNIPNGYRWIVTSVDHLNSYAEAAPLRSGYAQEIADFPLQNIIWRHGAPSFLLSDRGNAFLFRILADVLKTENTYGS